MGGQEALRSATKSVYFPLFHLHNLAQVKGPCQSSDKASIVNQDKTYLPKMYSFFRLANVRSILMFDYSWPKAQANQMTTEQKSFAAEWPANFWEKMEERDKE